MSINEALNGGKIVKRYYVKTGSNDARVIFRDDESTVFVYTGKEAKEKATELARRLNKENEEKND